MQTDRESHNDSATALEILKETSSLGRLLIRPVSKETAKRMVIEHHYSHKWNDGSFGKYNFGIFRADDPDRCLGVAVYGYMKNQRAKLFTHPDPRAWMCELNRMWIDDALGRNAESILISASIKLLRRMDPYCVAVQSFADGRLGCGTIYKAANFLYFGYHLTRFARNRRTGEVIHNQNFTNTTCSAGYLRSNIGYLIGDMDFFYVKTYRYIYPLDRRFRFHKPCLPYPTYERGEIPIKWQRNRTLVISHCIDILSAMAG